MTRKFSQLKALFVAIACGGIPLTTAATCDSLYGSANFFRDDDDYDDYHDDYYYDDYYYDDYYYDDYYCDPYYCY